MKKIIIFGLTLFLIASCFVVSRLEAQDYEIDVSDFQETLATIERIDKMADIRLIGSTINGSTCTIKIEIINRINQPIEAVEASLKIKDKLGREIEEYYFGTQDTIGAKKRVSKEIKVVSTGFSGLRGAHLKIQFSIDRILLKNGQKIEVPAVAWRKYNYL